MNQMLNSGQGPDNATFYNYLQYKMNHKNVPEHLGTPQIPLNPANQKSQSQAPKAPHTQNGRKEMAPNLPAQNGQQINLGQVHLANN